MARLIQLKPLPQTTHLVEDRVTIGRHPSQKVQVLDRLMSKAHALVERRGKGFVLVDLGSRNGSFHNGKQVQGEVALKHGDVLTMGTAEFRFEEGQLPVMTATPSVMIAAVPYQEAAIHTTIAAIQDSAEFKPVREMDDVERLRQDYEKLRLAQKLSRDIALELDTDRLLDKILHSLMESLPADRAVLLMVDPKTAEPESRCVQTRKGRDVGDITISRTILDRVIQTKEAVLSSDAMLDSRFGGSESIVLQGVRSTMSVPLVANERVIGVLHLDSLVSSNVFKEKDLSILKGLAGQAALAIENSSLASRLRQEALTRDKFARLLSPNLVERIVAGELDVHRQGEMREVSVLFSDIRGFTQMSERSPAEEIVSMLNEYFEAMVDVLFAYDGTLDKFMGDAIMALWGAPISTGNDALKAICAALGMQKALSAINGIRQESGKEPLRVGAGIASGRMVSGYMGSSKTMSYTVVGASVNLAARLCSAAKADEILITAETLEKAGPAVRAEPHGALTLKGISQPVETFLVTGVEDELSGQEVDP